MWNFALIGAAGFIAPRHLKAIKETGNNLIVALDKSDVVGIMDSYFPKCEFFTEFERFEAFVSNYLDYNGKIDFISICTPNYLHHPHIQFTLKHNANAICEKPLVLSIDSIEDLISLEKKTNKKVFTILQLRYHETILKLKNKIEMAKQTKKYDIDLTYLTSRGNWYLSSWKNETQKSGGVAMNIGIHFFDMLTWIFGKLQKSDVHLKENNKAAGYIELENARIRWFLSVDSADLGKLNIPESQRTYRSIKIENEELEFSEGFTELHTTSYQNILNGSGYGLLDVYSSIELASSIRDSLVLGRKGEYHPILDQIL